MIGFYVFVMSCVPIILYYDGVLCLHPVSCVPIILYYDRFVCLRPVSSVSIILYYDRFLCLRPVSSVPIILYYDRFLCPVFSIAGYSRLRRPAIILFRPAFIFQSWSEN